MFQDASLNNVYMSGLDLTKNLVGILIREKAIAISGVIYQMFYVFRVHEGHHDNLKLVY